MRDGAPRRARPLAMQTIRRSAGSGDLVAITGGLAEGDRVVVRGAETLTDGRVVSIQAGGASSSTVKQSARP